MKNKTLKETIIEKIQGNSKEEKIKYLEECLFYLDMKDVWKKEDYELHDIYFEIKQEIKEEK